MRKVRVLSLVLMAASLLQAGHVYAQTWDVSVTPRFALRFLAPLKVKSSPAFSQSEDSAMFWTGGATLSLSRSDWNRTEILFTGLYGAGGDHDWSGIANVNGAAVPSTGKSDDELIDIELLMRRPLGSGGANYLFGAQFVQFNLDQTTDAGQPGIFPGGLTTNDRRTRAYLVKAGLGGSFKFAESDYHRMFANFIVGVGKTDYDSDAFDDSATLAGADVNVGYQYVIDANKSMAVRYRAQVIRTFGFDRLEDDFTILHGPEMSVSFRF